MANPSRLTVRRFDRMTARSSGPEHVVPRHLGRIDRDGEQTCALFR